MKTIGNYLKEARVRKKYSREKLEQETKIKKEFIEAIEKEDWIKLPDYTVVVGFIKSLAQAVGILPSQAVAFLRRDYPPKKVDVNPKPDLKSKFSWSPKLTFIASIFIILLLVIGYLTFQYVKFMSPPKLFIDSPTQGQVITSYEVKISGETDKDASIKVNNQPILVSEEGTFSGTVEIFEGTMEIDVRAISRSGKETQIVRKIQVELK